MQLVRCSVAEGVMLVSLLLAPLAAAEKLDCSSIDADGVKFDLSKLRGPHSIVMSEATPPTVTNTTYTLDLCGPLTRKGKVDDADRCPDGTWVCAIMHSARRDDDEKAHKPEQVIPIAGELEEHGGKGLAFNTTRLKTSKLTSDKKKEGLRLVLHGGAYPLDAKPGDRKEQLAIVELRCDHDLEGTEGEVRPEEEYEGGTELRRRSPLGGVLAGRADDEDEDKPHGGPKQVTDGTKKQALVLDSYEESCMDTKVLQVTWRTKYACEAEAGGGDDGDKDGAEDGGQTSASWGFFTWFVVVVFLGTAAYLILGSWLNYNRYGARGWDLLPHGDTIRDVPYLLQDWVKGVVRLLQGGGSRGGYSAV